MCQSDKDNSAASLTVETKRLLLAIARLLDVPLSVFMSTTGEPDEGAGPSLTEPAELLKVYLDLAPGPRRELLAYARQTCARRT